MATHEVFNQTPPLADYDMFGNDTGLIEAVTRHGAQWALDELGDFGRRTGSAELMEHGRLANENKPVLRAFDRSGRRINVVEFHPSYHKLMATSMAAGIHSQPWTDERSGSMVARVAKSYLMSQVEAGHGCPMTMTFASVPALRHKPELAELWTPRVTARLYDSSNAPAGEKTACTVGMAMTEKQGGSDVRANTTQAHLSDDGSFRLVGHKWFCSAPMSDIFLMLAYEGDQLSCFLVPRWTPDGEPNGMNIQRLKDKLGDRSNASGEIEYDQAWAVRVGEAGRGVRTIIDMVAHTRLDCVAASAAIPRQALSQAIHHAAHRQTFGSALIEHPLMRNVLADLSVEVEAATALAFRLAAAFDAGQKNADEAAFARLATAIGKYWVCKRAPSVVYEAMECLGGNGYVEEQPLARLYRQAPLNSIWEGSGNVICLDVLRAMAREPASVEGIRSELDAALGQDRRYDSFVGRLSKMLADQTDVEIRARRLVEDLALALQASLLLRNGPSVVADAFVGSRLTDDRRGCLGALPSGIDLDALIARAHPSMG
jgi:putative acyl-CoA dehydrogenase